MKHLKPRLLASALVLAFGVVCVSPTHAQFFDDFDSYTDGQLLSGVNGWEGWNDDPGAAGSASSAQALSAPNSMVIDVNIDAVNQLGNPTSGKWDITTDMYLPSGGVNQQYYIMMNEYMTGAIGVSGTWAVQLQFDIPGGMLIDDYDTAGTAPVPIVFDQWVPLRVVIDLENDTVDQYYNGVALNTGQTWSTRNGGTAIAIGCVDLFSNAGSPCYWDNYEMAVFVSEPTVVVAETLSVMPGVVNAGDLTSLADSDNGDLSVFRDPNGVSAVTQFVITGTSPTMAPSALEFTLEGNVVSRPNVVQRIELWDYVASAYETMDEQDANRTPSPDKVVTVTPTGDLSRFVDQTNGAMQARVRYRADIARAQFASNTDQAVWSVTE